VKAAQIEVVFAGSDVIERAHRGETLLSCIRGAGLFISFSCDGQGVCGKCRVSAQGEPTFENCNRARIVRRVNKEKYIRPVNPMIW